MRKGALWLGPEADLYYMRNRWYESGTGRFLSEDPIGLEGGINPYVFAGSEPINGSDPTGMECIFQWVPEAWVTTPSGTSYQPGYYKANCRNQGTGRGAQLPSFGLGGALGGASKQRAAARSCRAGALSGSAFEFFVLRDIRSQADALLQLSLVDSRERHKWIIRAGNGMPQFGASTRIGAPNAGMVLVGAPPRSAIGEFHTHPDVAPGVPGGPRLINGPLFSLLSPVIELTYFLTVIIKPIDADNGTY